MEFSEAALQKVREDRLLIDAVDQWLYEEIAPFLGNRILEIGCGLGNFARHLADRSFYAGVEVSQDSVNYVNDFFRDHKHMRAYLGDATAEDFANFAQFDLDTIFSLNVFEHIEDHESALRNAYNVLQPGGRMILVVPAHMTLYGTIDRAIGHYRRYDKLTTKELFERVGFTCQTQKYINALGALGWWVNGRLGRSETPPSGQLRLFNKIVPLIKRLERILPPPFGISLLTVGQK